MKAVDPRVSFAELCRWPDDGRRYELYDGEVIVVPAPVPRHQIVAMNIGELLREYARATGGLMLISPIDIVFSEHDVLQPDLVFFRPERRQQIDMMKAARIPPDLAVEVLSRKTEVRDRGRKMDTFARFGVAEYWLVDPVRNTLEMYAHREGGYSLTGIYGGQEHVQSPTLAGLEFHAARVFQE